MIRTKQELPLQQPQKRERSRSRDREQPSDDISSSLFLVVSNLPFEASEDDIRKFMHTLRIEVSFIVVLTFMSAEFNDC